MKYNQVRSLTLRTPHNISCASLRKSNTYRTQSCPKCLTGTLEFIQDAEAGDQYASCLNCGKEFFPTPPVPIL